MMSHAARLKEDTDYGTLEERLAKRTNLPIALDGDDRREHQSVKLSTSHVQPPSEDTHVISERSVSRVSQWVDNLQNSQIPPVHQQQAQQMSDETLPEAITGTDTKIYESLFECLATDGKMVKAKLIALKEANDEQEVIRIRVIPAEKNLKPLTMHWSVGYERPGMKFSLRFLLLNSFVPSRVALPDEELPPPVIPLPSPSLFVFPLLCLLVAFCVVLPFHLSLHHLLLK
eukprot:755385-Hanusia_phi.AAC.4